MPRHHPRQGVRGPQQLPAALLLSGVRLLRCSWCISAHIALQVVKDASTSVPFRIKFAPAPVAVTAVSTSMPAPTATQLYHPYTTSPSVYVPPGFCSTPKGKLSETLKAGIVIKRVRLLPMWAPVHVSIAPLKIQLLANIPGKKVHTVQMAGCWRHHGKPLSHSSLLASVRHWPSLCVIWEVNRG